MMHSADQLSETRQMVLQLQEPWKSAYDDLIRRADGAEGSGRASHAAADFNVPGYYVDPKGHIVASEALNGDGWAAYACALAYQLTGDPTHGQKCEIARNARGVDLFSYGRLRLALDYLFYYSLYPEQWPHYAGKQTSLPSPSDWPGNLFEAMTRIYGSAEYDAWVADTRPHVVKGHHYAWTVPTLMRPNPVSTKGPSGAVLEMMRRASDWQIAHLSGGEPRDWVHAVFWAGLMASYQSTGEGRYADRATTWSQANGWLLGPRAHHADDHCAGQTYLELYSLDPQPERIRDTQQRLDAMVSEPHLGRVDWWWCDALFMAPPLFARLGAATGDPTYFDAMSGM
jgi:hypothetical protein